MENYTHAATTIQKYWRSHQDYTLLACAELSKAQAIALAAANPEEHALWQRVCAKNGAALDELYAKPLDFEPGSPWTKPAKHPLNPTGSTLGELARQRRLEVERLVRLGERSTMLNQVSGYNVHWCGNHIKFKGA